MTRSMDKPYVTRSEMLDKLHGSFDLLIIGGGITGVGIARDAARRGLKVALVEQDDLAYGTSSRSSKLVHGGLRYLEQYEFSLVFESVSERRILMDLAPHLVNPLGFLFPVYEGDRHNLWVINAGMWLYDGLSLFRSPKMHRRLKAREVAEEEPAVQREGLQGAPLYYDCATDDARLTLETAMDAAAAGAVIVTHCRATQFIKDDQGRLKGIVAVDTMSGEEREVFASATVNATGPWTDTVRDLGNEDAGDLLRPTKGIHIVVTQERLPITNAVVCFHPTDERVLFAIPWGDRTYIGTTDTDFEGEPGTEAATMEDVDYLLDASRHYFPEQSLQREDVISTWAGLRPLIAPPQKGEGVDESKVSREHKVVIGADGLITIAGGKLTTYRRMAAEVVDDAVRLMELSGNAPKSVGPCDTAKSPLPGAVGWPANDDHDAVAAQVLEASGGALAPDTARSLADTYGMRAIAVAARCAADERVCARLIDGRPEILAQVDVAVEEEFAERLSDVMIRRTQLYFRDHDQGLGVAELVASRMASTLGWDGERLKEELERYRADVARSRGWREG